LKIGFPANMHGGDIGSGIPSRSAAPRDRAGREGVTLDSISNSSLTRADFRAAPMMIYQYYPEFRVGSFARERGSAANRAYLTSEISKMV